MADATRLVSYFGNRYRHHFERDLEEIRAHGFDAVVHCVSEADYEWGMHRVAELFAMTRQAGLSCWADPWGLAGVFGGEAHSGYLARGGRVSSGDPALRALVRNWTDAVAAAGSRGRGGGGGGGAPARRALVRTWTAAVAAAGAGWVFWDDPTLGPAPDALVPFLADVTGHARERGLRNSVCLPSPPPNLPAFAR